MSNPQIQQEPGLHAILAYLATELLGWTRGDGAWWTGVTETHLRRLLTGDGMLEIIEAMRERGFVFECNRGEQSQAFFYPYGEIVGSPTTANELPEAVARAAYAALQESDHG